MDAEAAAPSTTTYIPPKIPLPEHRLSALGLLRTMVRNPMAAVPRAAYEQPVVRTRVGGRDIMFITGPEIVERILLREHEAFPKSHVDERIFKPIFGTGLLTAEGEDWRWKRRLAAPAFRQKALSAYLPAMRMPFEDLASRWAQAPGPHRVNEATTAATLDVVFHALFSGFDQLDGRRLAAAITRYLAPVSWTIAYGTLGLPFLMPHPGKIKMARAIADARRLVAAFIRRRRIEGETRQDLAQALIDARDPETGRSLSEHDLVDMFLTLIAAGHETSANALAWALYCLAAQPERQDALAAEVHQVLGSRPVGAEHLHALRGVERFIKEVMRLFPPAPLLARRSTDSCTIGVEQIPSDTILFIPVYAIHRHGALWHDADVFDPERFQESEERARHRCAYMPFGAGPRICIGGNFAMTEMVVGLASLLQRVRFLPDEGEEPRPVQRITLRPATELVLRIAPRPFGIRPGRV